MIYLQINELLKKRKRSKYWFIKNMGSGYQALSNLMNNATSGIHFETLNKICDLLECEPGDVIVRKKHKKKRGNDDEQITKAV
jgi:putative transcriptional regulator